MINPELEFCAIVTDDQMFVCPRYVFNTFAFAYSIGYHFIERETGSMNGCVQTTTPVITRQSAAVLHIHRQVWLRWWFAHGL